MKTRRAFIKNTSLAGGAILASPPYLFSNSSSNFKTKFKSKRPKKEDRTFISSVIEDVISDTKAKLKDKELAWLFENCFPNTLDTTVHYFEKTGKPDTHIITGDIPAMWLRDTTCQVWPYLPYANEDDGLKKMLVGLINRQIKCVLIDPYANAFYLDETTHAVGEWKDDITEMKPGVFERKWEINSLCHVIRLSYEYWKVTKDTSPFDATWLKAMKLIYQTFKEQQRLENDGPYSFLRVTEHTRDTVPHYGYGHPTRKNGMIHAAFRQDDANILPLFVPDNLMAIVELKKMAELSESVFNDSEFAEQCVTMANQIEKAIEEDAIVQHKIFGDIYAFEIDGYGGQILMEDPSLPGLISLPYMGICDVDDALYQRTRKFVLSEWNPFFEKGKAGEGLGSYHWGKGFIWPLGTISRALTTNEEEEIVFCINQLKQNHAGTGFIHESYRKDDPYKYNRDWFSWANTYFGEMILSLLKTHPHLLT